MLYRRNSYCTSKRGNDAEVKIDLLPSHYRDEGKPLRLSAGRNQRSRSRTWLSQRRNPGAHLVLPATGEGMGPTLPTHPLLGGVAAATRGSAPLLVEHGAKKRQPAPRRCVLLPMAAIKKQSHGAAFSPATEPCDAGSTVPLLALQPVPLHARPARAVARGC